MDEDYLKGVRGEAWRAADHLLKQVGYVTRQFPVKLHTEVISPDTGKIVVADHVLLEAFRLDDPAQGYLICPVGCAPKNRHSLYRAVELALLVALCDWETRLIAGYHLVYTWWNGDWSPIAGVRDAPRYAPPPDSRGTGQPWWLVRCEDVPTYHLAQLDAIWASPVG